MRIGFVFICFLLSAPFSAFAHEETIDFGPRIFIGPFQNPRLGVSARHEGHDGTLGGGFELGPGAAVAELRFRPNLIDEVHMFPRLEFSYLFDRRSDHLFYGLGPESYAPQRTRFGKRVHVAKVELSHEFLRNHRRIGLGANATTSVRSHDFFCNFGSEDLCGPDHQPNTFDDALPIDSRGNATPFSAGHFALVPQVGVFWDSRPYAKNWVRISLDLERAFWLRNDSRWLLSAGLLGVLDLRPSSCYSRFCSGELSLSVVFEAARSTSSIPFDVLPTLGGDRLIGFAPGRFRGDSILLSVLAYELDLFDQFQARFLVEAAAISNDRFSDLSRSSIRPSAGVNLSTSWWYHSSVHAFFGVGGTSFGAQPLAVDSARGGIYTNWSF